MFEMKKKKPGVIRSSSSSKPCISRRQKRENKRKKAHQITFFSFPVTQSVLMEGAVVHYSTLCCARFSSTDAFLILALDSSTARWYLPN